MDNVESVVMAALKGLRKGRGVLVDDLERRVSPEFRQLFGATTDTGAELRDKLIAYLEDLLLSLPDDLRHAARVALNLNPAEDMGAILQDRLDWLSKQSYWDSRTSRRRIDTAFARMAQNAVTGAGAVAGVGYGGAGWNVDLFDAVLRLDLPAPEAVERTTIVVTADALDRIVTSTDVPRAPEHRSESLGLHRELMFGGVLEYEERPSSTNFSTAITLPRTLSKGDRHTYCMIVRVPEGQPMAAHYVCVPYRNCRYFTVLVRFALDRLPAKVWRLDGVPQRAIDDRTPTQSLLAPNRAGEVYAEFRNLLPGCGYGIQWQE